MQYNTDSAMEYDGTNRYAFNSDGSLASVLVGDTALSYKYDALGRRVLKESGSGDSVLYLYDQADRCIAEYTSADDCAALTYSAGYVYADADDLGAPVAVEDAGGGYDFIATDPQGNVIYQTPSSSYIVLIKYDAYGNVYNISPGYLNLPFRFAGMRCEKDADIYLTPNRAYSPALGRWLQVDPLGTLPNPKQGNRFAPLVQCTDGQNLYEYCAGDPVNERDVRGLVMYCPGGVGFPGNCQDLDIEDAWGNDEIISEYFDWAGFAIATRWLKGEGDWTIFNDPKWTNYMESSRVLSMHVKNQLLRLSESLCKNKTNANRLEQVYFDKNSHGKLSITNGDDYTGYNFLNGPNESVGGFNYIGVAQVASNRCTCSIKYQLVYAWNDIIDPNEKYLADRVQSKIGRFFTSGKAKDYNLSIFWDEESEYYKKFFGSRPRTKTKGWPLDYKD